MNTGCDLHEGRGFELRPDGPGQSKTLLRRRDAFYDFFELESVVKADGEITALIGPSLTEDRKKQDFFVLGDALGKIYIFRPSGELLAEHQTGRSIPLPRLHKRNAFRCQ